MRTNIKLVVALLTIFSFTSCSSDDDSNNPPNITNEESLNQALQAIYNNSDIKGFAIGVVKNGETTYQHSFGFQNVENSIAYTNQTRQPLGSISKTFIGAALVKGVSLGYYTLDTPINDVLPSPIVNPNYPDDVIKIKHLVNHTSGLVDNEDTIMGTYYILAGENTASPAAMMMQDAGIMQREPQGLEALINAYYYPTGDLYSTDNFTNSIAGTQYSYSNIASSLAAYIVQVASGMQYEDFLSQYVLTPLQMTHTGFDYNPSELSSYSTLYYDDYALPLYNSDSYPDGFLKTSSDDLMKYLKDMIKGSMGNSELLFSAEYYDMLFAEDAFNHSVFWSTGDNIVTHSGSDPGLSCDLVFNKDTGSGFFILTNYDSSTDEHENHFISVATQVTGAVNAYLSN